MSRISFEELSNESNRWIAPYLENSFPAQLSEDITVKASMYSLMAGGKRLRPCLMYYSAKMLSVDGVKVAPFACALEMIHTYSLIHDDLPCMDNDDLRRGKPTCHKVFGEGIAVLAGDNLLNRANELMLEQAVESRESARAAASISRLAGIMGMIGGQSIDISSAGKKIEPELLYELQRKKTGALIEAAVTAPWFLTSYSEEVYDLLRVFAGHIGLAFQIKDDILDVESSEAELGKSVGKDERDMKPTFVTLLGLKEANAKLEEQILKARETLDALAGQGFDTSELRTVADYIAERDF